jgi:hypothetical protein
MRITRDITLGNILSIITMAAALLAFGMRIESRFAKLESQVERLIENGYPHRKSSHASGVPTFSASASPLFALFPLLCVHGVHSDSRPFQTDL